VGASIFGMNTSASMADVRAELEANEVRFVIVEDPRFASLLSKIDDERERHVLVIESMKGVQCGWGKVSQLSDVEVRGAQCLALSSADAFLRMIRSGSPLSVVGTEPDPASESRQLKVLQSAFVARLQTDTSRAQRTVSFVSQAGLAERVFQLRTVLSGGVSHFPEDSETIANDLQEVMPDRIEAPIRFWRERQGEILNAVADAPWLSRRIFAWASASTRPGSLRRMALYNVRHRMGLLRARSVIPSGTQELNLLCDWYRSIGVHVEAPAKERLGKSSESPVGKAIREETCLVGISPRCESGPST
jgi:hypothetical protein